MMAREHLPTGVLSDQIAEAINGRTVRTAVFTTFTFDPGFFELHILPILFDRSFSQIDKVRRIQLEECLRDVDQVAVYYDRSAIAQDGLPAQLDFARIDVRQPTGCFHPKVIFLLVQDPDGEVNPGSTSLLVAILSANLTRAGWWENVEVCHIEEVKEKVDDASRCPFRDDLFYLIKRIRAISLPGEDHLALDQVGAFLVKNVSKEKYTQSSSRGKFYTRIFCGQTALASWLSDLRMGREDWNLEIISPFFDAKGARPLNELAEAVKPKEIRVYLPKDPEGSPLVTEDVFGSVREQYRWAELPPEILRRGSSGSGEKLADRRVHAKIYRFWTKGGGDILLVGSPNLTTAALSRATSGNLEAAFLVDVSDLGFARRWWLQVSEESFETFLEDQPSEEEGITQSVIDFILCFDWQSRTASYRIDGSHREAIEILEVSGKPIHSLQAPVLGEWGPLPESVSKQIEHLLQSTSFLLLRSKEIEWRILVREENMAHRPSLLTRLTPEEILEYWSLLSPEQKVAFLQKKLEAEESLEGIKIIDRITPLDGNTLFDRFAGLFHAFGSLKRSIQEAIDRGNERRAVGYLYGEKFDSLPVFLTERMNRQGDDLVICYLTFLCAKQLHRTIRKQYPEFVRRQKEDSKKLMKLLDDLPQMRKRLLEAPEIDELFLDWYEKHFLQEAETVGALE